MKKDVFMIVHPGEDAEYKANCLVINDYEDYFETKLSGYFNSREEAEQALQDKIEKCKQNLAAKSNSIIGDYKEQKELAQAQAIRIVKAIISVVIDD